MLVLLKCAVNTKYHVTLETLSVIYTIRDPPFYMIVHNQTKNRARIRIFPSSQTFEYTYYPLTNKGRAFMTMLLYTAERTNKRTRWPVSLSYKNRFVKMLFAKT